MAENSKDKRIRIEYKVKGKSLGRYKKEKEEGREPSVSSFSPSPALPTSKKMGIEERERELMKSRRYDGEDAGRVNVASDFVESSARPL